MARRYCDGLPGNPNNNAVSWLTAPDGLTIHEASHSLGYNAAPLRLICLRF